MKKYLSVVLGLIIVLSLTGCKSKAETVSVTASPQQIENKKAIADAKVVADKRIADAEIVANKKISDAKLIADKKISDAKEKATSLASTTTEQSNQFTYRLYTNPRYGNSIMYPNNLTVIREPDNGDGRWFKTPDGEVELTVSGANNVLGSTVDSMYYAAVKSVNPSYKKQSGNWYVISYTEGDKVVYQKTVVGKGSMDTFILKYPINQNDKYSKVVEELNKSFKTPSIDECH
ncbi:hypothetical protein [Clostridium estertheticum]|uniref:hypothetical protein n=1 Tax=Clostridium estertheticum TaxID=238834 RepID=UPI001C7D2BBC|nr:hypothetical protein [Clostridium estertheticum]MBX4271864.1 hypothetical protein [Clostridium estertheticum]WLC78299.1 hypothetical protein KTC98_13775 [Clostridium estertheticum]